MQSLFLIKKHTNHSLTPNLNAQSPPWLFLVACCLMGAEAAENRGEGTSLSHSSKPCLPC